MMIIGGTRVVGCYCCRHTTNTLELMMALAPIKNDVMIVGATFIIPIGWDGMGQGTGVQAALPSGHYRQINSRSLVIAWVALRPVVRLFIVHPTQDRYAAGWLLFAHQHVYNCVAIPSTHIQHIIWVGYIIYRLTCNCNFTGRSKKTVLYFYHFFY